RGGLPQAREGHLPGRGRGEETAIAEHRVSLIVSARNAKQAPGRSTMSVAPDAERFPAYPVSWYLFGPSRQLRRGPVSRDVLGRRLVAWRTASGRAVVLDARCSHLGADL